MSVPMRSCLLALLLSACSSEEANDAGSGESSLSPAARAELSALGVERYKGKAVITEEVAQGDLKRVSFDKASGPICLRGADYAAFYADRGSDKTMI